MIIDWNPAPLCEAQQKAAPKVLDGKAIANARLEQLGELAGQFADLKIQPTLAVVQVGGDPASSIYIRHKVRACEKVGIVGEHHHLPADVRYPEVLGLLKKLNRDRRVHGILLQLPLPEGMDGAEALLNIEPIKDVDGFHPVNLGNLMAGRSLLEPCTPTGILTMLQTAEIGFTGKEAVVIGRSVIVGRPMALMLTRANATVTLCHRHTADLEKAVRRADIVVVATGVPELIAGAWIKEGAVVIDVGISRKDGGLVGDVEFDSAKEKASFITPVPGGVGPMTVATLMENTIRATCIQEGYVVRKGHVIPAAEADLRFETTRGLGVTLLCPGASEDRSRALPTISEREKL